MVNLHRPHLVHCLVAVNLGTSPQVSVPLEERILVEERVGV